jgi:heme exporter protein C
MVAMTGWAVRAGAKIGMCAVVLGAVAAVLALIVAPQAAVQGPAQRLMYAHVPAAWTAYLAFGCVALCSVAVLLDRPGRFDDVARAAAEVGVAMTALTIAEGSIWGHSAWGVWWAWDPRLVSTAVLLLSYTAYLAIRSLPGPEPVRRHRAAVAGLLFALEMPVVHFSVLWWRTLHQPPTLLRPSLSPPIDPVMLTALLVAVLAFSFGAAWYVRRRVEQLAAVGVPEPDSAPVRTAREATR